MSLADLTVAVLLGLGVASELLACAGLASMGTVYDRLHYLALSTFGAVPIAAAIWVREGPSTISLKATLLAAFLVVAMPALTHATARSARIAERGDWRAGSDEQIEVE